MNKVERVIGMEEAAQLGPEEGVAGWADAIVTALPVPAVAHIVALGKAQGALVHV